MGFEDRSGVSVTFIASMASSLWEKSPFQKRILHVPFGYDSPIHPVRSGFLRDRPEVPGVNVPT